MTKIIASRNMNISSDFSKNHKIRSQICILKHRYAFFVDSLFVQDRQKSSPICHLQKVEKGVDKSKKGWYNVRESEKEGRFGDELTYGNYIFNQRQA